jgi:hypothetical protein
VCKSRILLNKNKQGALSSYACESYRFSFYQLYLELSTPEYNEMVDHIETVSTKDWELELNCLTWQVKISLSLDRTRITLCCSVEEYNALSFLLMGHNHFTLLANNQPLN